MAYLPISSDLPPAAPIQETSDRAFRLFGVSFGVLMGLGVAAVVVTALIPVTPRKRR